MSRAEQPPGRLGEAAAPLTMVGVFAAGALVMLASGVAAHAAAQPGFAVPTGSDTLSALVIAAGRGSLDPLIGPAGSRPLFWLVGVSLLAPVLAAAAAITWWAVGRASFQTSPEAALAGRRDYQDMHGKAAAERARKLRPSLAGAPVKDRDLGMRLGILDTPGAFTRGVPVYASEEEVMLEIAGPRSNKTSAFVVPAVLTAPGPLITTSNKVDVYTLTVRLRALVGRVFVCDPQGIAGVPPDWWFNPLRGITDMAGAQYLVAHFSATIGAGNERADPYFTKGAERLIGQHILAAALDPADTAKVRSLRDVRTWLATRSDEPVGILKRANMKDVADGLMATIEAPPDQRGGLYETALAALACLESESVARYVTPPSTWRETPKNVEAIIEFDPWQFLVGYPPPGAGNDKLGVQETQPIWGTRHTGDTLYLLTREGAGTGAPIVAALVDQVLRTAATAATALGGRLDPPLRAVLDEAANICPIQNLPDLYSYFGSMSIQVMTFLQSYQQGVAVWGKAGMDKLWSAATIKLIGAGVHDPEFCEHVSRLVGPYEKPNYTLTRARGGGSDSVTTRSEPIKTAAEIAALPRTQAVVIAAGRKPGLIRLLPWYTEPEADEITTNAAISATQVREAAVATLGPDNPLSRALDAETKAS